MAGLFHILTEMEVLGSHQHIILEQGRYNIGGILTPSVKLTVTGSKHHLLLLRARR